MRGDGTSASTPCRRACHRERRGITGGGDAPAFAFSDWEMGLDFRHDILPCRGGGQNAGIGRRGIARRAKELHPG